VALLTPRKRKANWGVWRKAYSAAIFFSNRFPYFGLFLTVVKSNFLLRIPALYGFWSKA
jgi:hypothetical protein